MDTLVITIFVVLVLAGVLVNVYNHTSHSKAKGKILKKDASIWSE